MVADNVADIDTWRTERDGKASTEGNPRRVSRRAGEYDADEFYVRSTNKHDHSEQTRIRIPGDVLAELSGLIASKEIPEYRTVSDFFRDAAVHRLHYIADMSGNAHLMFWVQAEMRASRVEAQEREAASNQALVDSWKKRVNGAMNAGDRIGLDKAREMLADDIEWVREPYKGMLIQILGGIV